MLPLLALFALLCTASGVQLAKLTLMVDAVNASGAMCIDGTPAGYYFTPGTDEGKNKWFLFHEVSVCMRVDALTASCAHRHRS